jgi:hypothetical protein
MLAFWTTLRANAPTELQAHWPTRRAFLLSALGAVLAAFLPPVPGQRAERAAAAPFVQAAELLGVAYHEKRCNCKPGPKSPKEDCPSCRCDAKDPAEPAKPCTKANKLERATTESAGACKGTLKDCAGKPCKRTSEWQCLDNPLGTDTGFRWNFLGTAENCPTFEKETTTKNEKGKCVGVGCKEPEADCVATQKWRCARDTDGKWEPAAPPTNDCKT